MAEHDTYREPVRLRVGCAMWAYKAWQGRHFPAHLERAEQLPVYASWCNAVEGNTTYYGLPSERTVAAWAAEAPPDLWVVFKLPRTITHEHRLRGAEDELAAFLDRLAPLGERAGQLSIQLPPSFGPGNLGTLAAFIDELPDTHRFAVEIRHRAFYDDPVLEAELEEVLTAGGVEWINLDTTTLYGVDDPSEGERDARRQKPPLPRRPHAIGDHPIVRFVGIDDVTGSEAGWQPLIPVVAGWLAEGRTPTLFVHTPDNVDAPLLARRFHDQVRLVVPDLAPLPTPLRPDPPSEPTLF
ncbi:MAG: DUF72 domain-containing protein [Ilumatobacteraceae bacterium]